MEAVEEAAYVEGLGAQSASCRRDHLRCEAEARRNVDAGRGSGDALAQLVGGREGLLVEAYGSVDDALSVFRVDLERGVVRGDDGPGAGAEEVLGDGDGQGCAFFG